MITENSIFSKDFIEEFDIKNINFCKNSQEWQEISELTKKAFTLLIRVKNEDIKYEEFKKHFWQILDDLHSKTSHLENIHLKRLQLFFRGSLFKLISQSNILSRALSKPFGYPGDFIMLQTLYNKKPTSSTNIGRFLDQFFIDDKLAQAVINRVEVMGDRIINFINNCSKKEIHILNIASGSGFEFNKIIKQNFEGKKIVFHCFDQEIASLSYISNNFINKNKNIEINLYQEDVKVFFRNWKNESGFDFIYNIGLADYLTDKIIASLIKESIDHLNKNGIFVLAHKDYTLFPYHHPSWLYDWNFIHRKLEDYQHLLVSNFSNKFDFWFESNQKIVYFSEVVK